MAMASTFSWTGQTECRVSRGLKHPILSRLFLRRNRGKLLSWALAYFPLTLLVVTPLRIVKECYQWALV